MALLLPYSRPVLYTNFIENIMKAMNKLKLVIDAGSHVGGMLFTSSIDAFIINN